MKNKSIIKKIKMKDVTTYDINIPVDFKLFRMRSNNENCISAFINDEIWGTAPAAFNDPYDTTYVYNRRMLYEYAKIKINTDDELNRILCEINEIEHNKYSANKLAKLLVDSHIVGNENQNRNLTVSACFTEKIDNEIMWAHYANNAKGFALEYSFEKLKQFGNEVDDVNNNFIKENFSNLNVEDYDRRMPRTLIPMLYENYKYDMTDYFKHVIDNELNNIRIVHIEKKELTILTSLLNLLELTSDIRKNDSSFWEMNCLKKKEWNYEREWRLISYNMNPFLMNLSNHYKIGMLIPDAIYLGERISEYDKKALMIIAKDKSIPVYQMTSIMKKNTMKLVPMKIEYYD